MHETDNSRVLQLARAARAMIVGKGDPGAAEAWIANQYGTCDAREIVRKAAILSTGVLAPDGDVAELAGALLGAQVDRGSLVSRIDAEEPFLHVDFYRSYLPWAFDAVASFVAEAAEKPLLDQHALDAMRLEARKVAGLLVYTAETLKAVGPKIDARLNADAASALRKGIDSVFCGAAAASAAQPPGIFHDRVFQGSGGTDPEADIGALLAMAPPDYVPVLLMNPRDIPQAFATGLADGSTLTNRGGYVAGYVVCPSWALPQGAVAYAIPQLIMLALGPAYIVASIQATVAYTDDEGDHVLSCWERNLHCIRAERFVNWSPVRPDASACMLNVFATLPDAHKAIPLGESDIPSTPTRRRR